MIHSVRDSLLMIACKSGFIECVKSLLGHNADIKYRTYSGSVLKSVCLICNVEMLRCIVERVALTDQVILYLLACPEIITNTEIAAILVGYIQNVNWDGHCNSFLYIACGAGSWTIARMLLERGASIVSRYSDSLASASRGGNIDVVKLLLSWDSDNVRVSQESIDEALINAARSGHVNVARYLVEYGTSADALNSALFSAVVRHEVELAAFLIDSGADFNVIRPTSDYTTWILACFYGVPDMVRLLLDRGADPNAVSARGDWPLKIALLRPEVLSVLLEHGADPSRTFADGSPPILELVQREQSKHTQQAITILLEHGADPNLSHATTGETALMRLAIKLRVDLVQLLLEHGADVTQVNREGKSVLDMLGRTRKYCKVRELCAQYIDSNKPGAKHVLK